MIANGCAHGCWGMRQYVGRAELESSSDRAALVAKAIVEKTVRIVRIIAGVSALAAAKMPEVAKDGRAEGFLHSGCEV